MNNDFKQLNNILHRLADEQGSYVRYSELIKIESQEKKLLHYLQILEGENHIEKPTHEIHGVWYCISKTGRIFIASGGYKNKWILWVENPDNWWKILVFIAGTAITIWITMRK